MDDEFDQKSDDGNFGSKEGSTVTGGGGGRRVSLSPDTIFNDINESTTTTTVPRPVSRPSGEQRRLSSNSNSSSEQLLQQQRRGSNSSASADDRRMSLASNAFQSYLEMSELRKDKDDWMSSLDNTNTHFIDLFKHRDSIVADYSLSQFITGTEAALKRGRNSTPALNATQTFGVRRKTIQPQIKFGSRLPCLNVNFATGKVSTSMNRQKSNMRKSMDQSPSEMVVVTGKVNYGQLLDEQARLKCKTDQADQSYKEMMVQFDAFQNQVERRFSLMLKDGMSITSGISEDLLHNPGD